MGQRLLVLDTDGAFLVEHRATLEHSFDVDFLANPVEAFRMLESLSYGAILISVKKPEDRGYALCANIRNHQQLANFKVILIGSKSTKNDLARHKKLRVRADVYLSRPIAARELVSALGALIPPKTSALGNTLDVLTKADIADEWLESLDSVETASKNVLSLVSDGFSEQAGKSGKAKSKTKESREAEAALHAKTLELMNVLEEKENLQRQNAATIANFTEVKSALQAKTTELSTIQEEFRELQSQNTALSANLTKLESELWARTSELSSARLELTSQNSTITQNLEALDEREKSLEDLRSHMEEVEDHLKYLESPKALVKFADAALHNRIKDMVSEKKALLQQVEALTQEKKEKNQEVIAILRSREETQQNLLDIEDGMRRLEQEFEERVEGERRLMLNHMEDLKKSESVARKRARELEELCEAKTVELELIHGMHAEEKRRLMEEFGTQKQSLVASLRSQMEEIRKVSGTAPMKSKTKPAAGHNDEGDL